jgi:hypothetical protein
VTAQGSSIDMTARHETDQLQNGENAEKTFVQDFLSTINQQSSQVPDALRMSKPTRRAPQSPSSTDVVTAGKFSERELSRNSGRVVINHSTHIPGLIAALQRLAETKGVSTVVPGRLYTAGGRQASLSIRVTVPTEGGFKLLARKGSQTQEVFVITDLDRDTLEGAIAWSL